MGFMNDLHGRHALSPQTLRRRVRLRGFETTETLEPLDAGLGQERALEAVGFAVAMKARGFNLYAMGSTGLGRHTLLAEALNKVAARRPPVPDWCYLYDFDRPQRPRALALPAGEGRELKGALRRLIEDLLLAIPAAFQGDEFQRRATEIREELERREERLTEELERRAEARGVLVLRTDEGYSLMPERQGKALEPEEYRALPREERKRIDQAMEEVKEALKETLVYLPQWRLEMQRRLQSLERETARLVVAPMVARLRARWQRSAVLGRWLEALQEEVVRNIDLFRGAEEERTPSPDEARFRRFGVNVVVDNGDARGAPVVREDNPTCPNLVGRLEYFSHQGALETDFTLLKAGALQRANGGFLLLDAEKLLEEPLAWDALKRTLRAGEVRIEPLDSPLGPAGTLSLEPEPIPIDLKVVLVGGRELFFELREADPEFSLLFKVAADFAEEFPRTAENEAAYARLVAMFQQREELRPFSRQAVERLIEEAARRTGRGDRISLHLASLNDLMHEADAHAAGRERVERRHLVAALSARRKRLGQLDEQLREQMLRGLIRLETAGVQLGQVNALSYIEAGDIAFGAPSRVSATARLGNGEFVDIERETELGGPIHSKGVMILTAYLAARYARHMPLPMTATLVFEQSYGPVEGDSASAAELCALVSALGDLPLKQSLAITGSVNQHGQMQSVGGVCEKIEGFFRLCRARSLDGSHGVIIPRSDVPDLMLDEEVVEAAQRELFHLYAVDHVEQALELLTGLPAGLADADGNYPANSVNGQVQRRLAQWAALRQRHGVQEKGDG